MVLENFLGEEKEIKSLEALWLYRSGTTGDPGNDEIKDPEDDVPQTVDANWGRPESRENGA